MKISHLLLAFTLLQANVWAHDDHDWSSDYLGFLSVEYMVTPVSSKKIKRAKRIDVEFYKEKLAIFSGDKAFNGQMIKERGTAKNLDIARAFLKAEYEAVGFEVSLQPFSSGVNFIAEKKGLKNPEKVLILSSHIDSVGNKGANDNGTGTIGLMTVAQELAKNNYDFTVRILGFDREEVGLKGSDAYVATLTKKENIIGNINFEMMGTNSRKDGAFHIIDCKYGYSQFLTTELSSAISTLSLPLTVVKGCTDRSDHASFWRKKIPAVVVSENFFGGDSDSCYHAKCDIMDDRLDYGYMSSIMEAVLEASEKLLVKAK